MTELPLTPTRPSLEIHAMVYGYWKRLWWNLSSIRDQVSPGFNISYRISVTERDPWISWMPRVQEVFGPSISIIWDIWGKDDLQYGKRGSQRTRAISSCETEWLLFIDADQVYSPTFFRELECKVRDMTSEHRVISVGRWGTSFENGYKLVDSETYQGVIDRSFDKAAATNPVPSKRCAAVGAGFFQLVHMPSVKKYAQENKWPSLTYVAHDVRSEHNTLTGLHITPSDIVFRKRLGGVVPIRLESRQIHINHYRRQDGYDPTIMLH